MIYFQIINVIISAYIAMVMCANDKMRQRPAIMVIISYVLIMQIPMVLFRIYPKLDDASASAALVILAGIISIMVWVGSMTAAIHTIIYDILPNYTPIRTIFYPRITAGFTNDSFIVKKPFNDSVFAVIGDEYYDDVNWALRNGFSAHRSKFDIQSILNLDENLAKDWIDSRRMSIYREVKSYSMFKSIKNFSIGVVDYRTLCRDISRYLDTTKVDSILYR